MKSKDHINVPGWEFGPGSYFDYENNTLYGVSGVVYHDLQVRREDVERLIKEIKKREIN